MHDKVQKVLLGCGGGVSELLNNEKLGVTELVFELNAFKAKIKGAFTGCTVALVIYYALEINSVGRPMAGH